MQRRASSLRLLVQVSAETSAQVTATAALGFRARWLRPKSSHVHPAGLDVETPVAPPPVLSQEVDDVEGVPVPHADGQVERRLSGLLSTRGSRKRPQRSATAQTRLTCNHGNYRNKNEEVSKATPSAADRSKPDCRQKEESSGCGGGRPPAGASYVLVGLWTGVHQVQALRVDLDQGQDVPVPDRLVEELQA